MPYVKETYTNGDICEIEKYYSSRFGKKGIKRGDRKKPTSEEMEKINARNAAKQLRRLIETNFTPGDYHLVLTYRKGDRPSPMEAKELLVAFLRKLRQAYRKSGYDLKYISVTEMEARSIHHHLIINACDPTLIQQLWRWGRPHMTMLDDEGGYKALAEYLIKETSRTFGTKNSVQGKRYNCSRNLKQPSVKKEIVRADSWREHPTAPKGWIVDVDSVITGSHAVTGYAYQAYRLLRVRKKE